MRTRTLLAFLLSMLHLPSVVHAAPSCTELLARQKITLVVPFKPGGGFDTYARTLAPVLQQHTGGRVSVANIAGANGMVGVRAVASAGANAPTIGVFDMRDLLAARLSDASLPRPEDFFALGSFGGATGIWATRQSMSRLLDGDQPLTFGLSTGMVPRVLLPAMLLDREVRLVRGYGGLAERWLALQRGEVDLTDGSNDTLGRYMASSPGTMPLLVLSDGPLAEFPGTPFLAGQGGLVDQRTKGLDERTRSGRMALARLAAELSANTRTLAVSARMPAPMRVCLEQAVETALFSQPMREAAAARKLPLDPIRGIVVRGQLAAIERTIEAHRPLLTRLATGS